MAVETRVLDLSEPEIERQAKSISDAHHYGLVIYNAVARHAVGLVLDKSPDHALNLVRLNCAAPIAFAHAALSAMRPP